ncbi:MAG TPA: glycine--tRNA ligase subunit beta, partial [Pseudonocardiaceae bacterium]|nr:glycine--tRNA ligase subunit beta [Pseudonocardiaceae bacterium]
SQMVIELTSLAGVMAREYARRAGESETVSQALFEMELPRSAGDALPETTPGALLALADRLDLLVGLFGIGATPTGSSDPFGLRRAALGVVNILRSFPVLRDITALQRVRRIVPTGTVSSYHPDKLSEPTEVALHDALRKVSAVVEENSTLGEFADAANALTNPINAFFDGVLVMADDPEVRNTRLGLLASICELAGTVIDWQALGTAGR